MHRWVPRGLRILAGSGFTLLLTATAARAEATASTVSQSIPLEAPIFVDCAGGTGELVRLSGMLHLLFHVTETEQGLHLKFQAQPQGVSGVGMTSGAKYQGTGVTQDQVNFTAGATEASYVNNFRIIGQGPGNNLLVHVNLHFTVNANGDITASPANVSGECR